MESVKREPDPGSRQRVHVFVDHWNFILSMQKVEYDYRADFRSLGPALVRSAMDLVDSAGTGEYAGMAVYISTEEGNPREAGLRKWATNTLDRLPGVNVKMVSRVRKRSGPDCPVCHDVVHNCPACGADMRGTEEKGVDVRIATDMIMLAWIDSYDIAVLVSSDSDFVPAVEFLHTKGKKVIHAQFPPFGSYLSQKCWGSISIPDLRDKFRLVGAAPRPPRVAPIANSSGKPPAAKLS
jgi:uncharacterized LabA/DUF88 family protein